MTLAHRRRCVGSGRWSGPRRRTSSSRWPCRRSHGHVLWRSLPRLVLAHSLLFSWHGTSGHHWSYRSKSGSNWSHIGGWSDRTHRHRSCFHLLNRLLSRLLFRLLIRIENSRVMARLRGHRTRNPGWRIHGLLHRRRLGTHAVRTSWIHLSRGRWKSWRSRSHCSRCCRSSRSTRSWLVPWLDRS